jgi:predicted dehydrogenase
MKRQAHDRPGGGERTAARSISHQSNEPGVHMLSSDDPTVKTRRDRTVLLVGCGNIGFRHLQAICATTAPATIEVIEPNAELHPRIRDEFAVHSASGHELTLSVDLPTESRHYELVVVATNAEHRRAVVEQVLERHDVSTMILEKVLFQRVIDLVEVGELLERNGVSGFVNCGRRTFPGYQELRGRLVDNGPTGITVVGQRLGLASNAVHFIDLAEYLNGSTVVSVETSGLERGSVPSKRPGCVEIFGVLTAELSNGARVVIESRDVDPVMIEIQITGAGKNVAIDELKRTVRRGDAEQESFVSQNVSETYRIYEQALESGTCELTPYSESAEQHRLYIEALRSHLGLSNALDTPCPIS